MKSKIKVYVAGPYSGDNVLSVLKNIGKGEKTCAKLFKMGFAPFCPWHDKSYIIDNPYTDFSVEDFREASMAWLKASDIVLVTRLREDSQGTMAEIKEAEIEEIPVVYSIDDLVEYCAFFNPS